MENQTMQNTENSAEQENVPVNPGKNNGKATAGFVLGLVSIIAWIIPLFGIPVSVIGIIMSALGIKSEKKTKAIVGLVFSIIFLIATIINAVYGAMLFSKMIKF